jgi:hypothetical protein
MDAAPGHEFHGRGAPRLLRHFALLDRLTGDEGPSGRLRLEHELGCDLADFLVGALARPRTADGVLTLCASA